HEVLEGAGRQRLEGGVGGGEDRVGAGALQEAGEVRGVERLQKDGELAGRLERADDVAGGRDLYARRRGRGGGGLIRGSRLRRLHGLGHDRPGKHEGDGGREQRSLNTHLSSLFGSCRRPTPPLGPLASAAVKDASARQSRRKAGGP